MKGKAVVPPIRSEDETIGQLQVLKETGAPVPPKGVPVTTPRKPKFKDEKEEKEVIPAILNHNQNLDYNNRATLYLENLVYTCEDRIFETKEGKEKVEKEKDKSGIASRIWKRGRVRENVMKGLGTQF